MIRKKVLKEISGMVEELNDTISDVNEVYKDNRKSLEMAFEEKYGKYGPCNGFLVEDDVNFFLGSYHISKIVYDLNLLFRFRLVICCLSDKNDKIFSVGINTLIEKEKYAEIRKQIDFPYKLIKGKLLEQIQQFEKAKKYLLRAYAISE